METTEEMAAIMKELGVSSELISYASNLIFTILDQVNPLAQRPLLCMIFEKIAFDNKMSVTDLVDEMHTIIHVVDKEEGEYNWPEDEINKRDEKWKEERAKSK